MARQVGSPLIVGDSNLRNPERERSHCRFAIDLELQCRRLRNGSVVLGKSCDICSGGVRFASSETLAPATRVELSIDWPALLNGDCPLQLKVRGHVLRNDQHGTAIEIEHYEFRTRQNLETAAAQRLITPLN